MTLEPDRHTRLFLSPTVPQAMPPTVPTIARRFGLRSSRAEYDLDFINRAFLLATLAHHGQTRKDGTTPQVLHPMAVQSLLARVGIDNLNLHAAALLHDALEDNPGERGDTLRIEIENTLGGEVLAWVDYLTDATPADMPRHERKAAQLERMRSAPWEVKVIKLADVVASVLEGPALHWTPQYAAAYVAQRQQLVNEVLRPSCAELAFYFSNGVQQPLWQAALAGAQGGVS